MLAELTDETERAEPAGAPTGLHATEDAMLDAAARKGKAAAFATLVERHKQRIFSMALRITVHLNQFAGDSSFSTWLTRITINEALTLLRKNRGSHKVSIDESSATTETVFVLEIPDSRPSPEEIYSRLQQEQILALSIKQLKPETRTAIQLRGLDDRSVRETAQILESRPPG